MVVLPAEIPVTTPVLLIPATGAILLLHTPVAAESDKAVSEPTHNDNAPAIAPASGRGLTISECAAVSLPQLLVTVYKISELPAATPVTLPVADPAVATVVLLLLQCPPGLASDSVVITPAHTLEVPVMIPAAGNGLTVIIFVALAVPQKLVTV